LLSQTRRQLTDKLRQALDNEYREIVVGDRAFHAFGCGAASFRQPRAHGWIPQPVSSAADLSLSRAGTGRLYALGTSSTSRGRTGCSTARCRTRAMPSERQFEVMVSEYQHLLTTDLTPGAERWQASDRGSESMRRLAERAAAEFSDDLRRQSWRPYAITPAFTAAASGQSGSG
jgi:hypothetical protein